MLADKSECFTGAVRSTPDELTFGMDGSISLVEAGHYNYKMSGLYTINGGNLLAEISGTHEESGTTYFGLVAGTPSQVQVHGNINCSVTVSNARLAFTDATGQMTVLVRNSRQKNT